MQNFQQAPMNPMYPQNQIPQPNFYNNMPPGINWQQEMMNRLNTLQQQVQNSFIPQQNVQQTPQNFLKGRVAGSKEEVLSAQVDFAEPQYFPVGNDVIFVKRLGMDGKSEILEYRLNLQDVSKNIVENNNDNKNYENNFLKLRQDFDELSLKYDAVYSELTNLKRELGIERKPSVRNKKEKENDNNE